jgi:hypothetical protein
MITSTRRPPVALADESPDEAARRAEFRDFARGGNVPPNDQLTWYRFGKNSRKVPCEPPAFDPLKVAA